MLQFKSELLSTTVVRPVITETTALGAAYLAGLAVGYWKDIAEIEQYWQADQKFNPLMPAATVQQKANNWKQAINATAAYGVAE